MSQFPDLELSVERDGLGFYGEAPYNSTTICHTYFLKGKREKKLIENSGTEFFILNKI